MPDLQQEKRMSRIKHTYGDSAPTKLLATGGIVHLALWSPLLNQTRCGESFSTEPAGVDGAEQVEESVSCMTCLVRADIFEIPIPRDPHVNNYGELVYFVQVFGPNNYTTECCHAAAPCDWHEPKELP